MCETYQNKKLQCALYLVFLRIFNFKNGSLSCYFTNKKSSALFYRENPLWSGIISASTDLRRKVQILWTGIMGFLGRKVPKIRQAACRKPTNCRENRKFLLRQGFLGIFVPKHLRYFKYVWPPYVLVLCPHGWKSAKSKITRITASTRKDTAAKTQKRYDRKRMEMAQRRCSWSINDHLQGW